MAGRQDRRFEIDLQSKLRRHGYDFVHQFRVPQPTSKHYHWIDLACWPLAVEISEYGYSCADARLLWLIENGWYVLALGRPSQGWNRDEALTSHADFIATHAHAIASNAGVPPYVRAVRNGRYEWRVQHGWLLNGCLELTDLVWGSRTGTSS